MYIIKPNLAKRSGAAILDFVVLYLLISLLRYFVVYPIYDAMYDLKGIEQSLKTIAYDSHLYVEDAAKGDAVSVSTEAIPAAVYDYYALFKDGKTYAEEETAFAFSNEWYNTTILKIGSTDTTVTIYFEYDVDELQAPDPTKVGVPLATTTAEQLTTFYTDAYKAAQDDLLKYPQLMTLNQQGSNYDLQMTMISLGFNLILLHLLVPLFLKHGRTIGKKVFNLAVVTKDGYHLQFPQHVIRFIVFGLETFFGVYTLFIGYLVPYTFMVFTKKNQAPHDMAGRSLVVDMKGSIIFKDEEDMRRYEAEPKPSLLIDAPQPLAPSDSSSVIENQPSEKKDS